MKGDVEEFGDSLTVLTSLRKSAQGQSLNLRDCIGARHTIRQDARKIADLGNLPAVRFLLDLDKENHCTTSWPESSPGTALVCMH